MLQIWLEIDMIVCVMNVLTDGNNLVDSGPWLEANPQSSLNHHQFISY